MVVVDIHCHTFNADDLPVRGFIRRTRFDDGRVGDQVAALVDKLIQKRAPGYAAERAKLDQLLGATADLETAISLEGIEPDLADAFEDDVDRAVLDLTVQEPELMNRLAVELAVAESGDEEGIIDAAGAARRIVRWVKIFGELRVTNTALLVRNFSDSVDLFTPLLVDLDMGLHDRAGTRIREQMELHEKISRLSMLGRLGGVSRARIHPFIGFDPRRDVADRRANEVETSLDVVRLAVETYGFVGVKLYPPMGFRPIGNGRTREMDQATAVLVDEVLSELYTWCEAEDVPITVHCNRSNEAHDDYLDFSAPSAWAQVLQRWPGLRLNLGHFGGAAARIGADGWPWQIARLANDTHPNLYADVGNHKIYDDELRIGYFAMLETMFREDATSEMANRLMFGSDWYMLASMKGSDEFLDRYRETYQDHFGRPRTEAFLGGNALRFLGFDDATNKNARRLLARYERYASDGIPDWLARPA